MTTTMDMHGYIKTTDVIDVHYNQSVAYDNATDVSNSTFKYSGIL